jgi:putative addiction module component (TIGR02574 family)
MSALENIETQAMHLEPAERALLAAHLIASLDSDTDENADELWAREAEARYAAYQRGESEATPAEEVLKRASEKLK